MTPILLLEINEVPWRVIDHYAKIPDFAHIRQFFARSHQFTSVTLDTGELSPWVTWPTLHRGICNESHGIKNLGQDPSTYRGKPIWQEIRDLGGSIGICGSLQSWPPIEPGPGGFYLPDTFAQSDASIPDYLNPIQAFNLSQVRKNARVVNSKALGLKEVAKVSSSLFKSGISIKTCFRAVGQLISEKFGGNSLGRRPTFQTIVFWDIFCNHFDQRRPPQFSTFFTNHIAGVMHRYWCDIFPEDFPLRDRSAIESREPLMHFALTVLDDMLAKVIKWSNENPDLVVVFATSMGQAAIDRDYHQGYDIIVEDLVLLMTHTGINRSDFVPLLAMAPQVAVEILDPAKRLQARTILEGIYCDENIKFVKVHEIGSSLSITVSTPAPEHIISEQININGQVVKLTRAGMRKQKTEAGTAYHIPEGIFAIYDHDTSTMKLDQSRSKVNSEQLKDWMLRISRDRDAVTHSLVPGVPE